MGRQRARVVFCLVLALAACDSKAEGDKGEDKAAKGDKEAAAKAAPGVVAKPESADDNKDAAGDGDGAGPAAAEPDKREEKDFGAGSMVLDGEPWAGTSAKAKMKNTTLILTIARNDFADGKASREELKLYLKEFAGPGDYVASERGSQLLRVGVNTDKLDKGEAKANAEVKKSVRGPTVSP